MDPSTSEKPKIKFRNYKPYDQSLWKSADNVVVSVDSDAKISKDSSTAPKTSGEVKISSVTEVPVQSAVDKILAATPVDIIQQELEEVKEKLGTNELNIVPKKVNWDLKRHAEFKVEKLRKRTQRAIVEILREKLAENGDGEEADTDDDIDT